MAANWKNSNTDVQTYDAPSWTSSLAFIPQARIQLAQLPTPVHKWDIRDLPSEFELFIKRDDLTGNALSGNKVRKLEFILAEALSRGCKHVMTSGTMTSNHCRTTAVAAAQVGLKCHLFLLSENVKDCVPEGNMFLNSITGADIYLFPCNLDSNQDHATEIWEYQLQLAEQIKRSVGEKSYVIPSGGSDTVGLFGYTEAFNELIEQGMLGNITDLVFTCGSGGTAAGLVVAHHLSAKHSIRLHGIIVTPYTADYFYEHCDKELRALGIDDVTSRDSLHLVDYLGEGYRKASQQDLDFIYRVGAETGIVLDPTYTGKAVRALLDELHKNPQHFKGNKILFLHTGGLFGAMDHMGLITTLKNQSVHSHKILNQQNDKPIK